MTTSCTTSVTDTANNTDSTDEPDGTGKGAGKKGFYTYEGAHPHAHGRAFEESAMESARSARQSQRARTHAWIGMIPGFAVAAAAAAVGLTATVIAVVTWGPSSALSLQMGAIMAGAYTVMNDVRISIAEKNPDWRRRHRVLACILRRNPLDLN